MRTQVRQQFDGSPASVRQARQFLHDALGERVGEEAEDDLVLALTELTTNAVQHARTAFEVVVETDGSVRLEVEDGSTERPVDKEPSDEGGRGLGIVRRLCDRWGVHVAAQKKCVWCERDLSDA
jgi:anti-sigma regulatory factor (Ser/Thr protein kinase)